MTCYLGSVPLLPFESPRNPGTLACAAHKALLDKPESVDREHFRQGVKRRALDQRSALVYLTFNSWLASDVNLQHLFKESEWIYFRTIKNVGTYTATRSAKLCRKNSNKLIMNCGMTGDLCLSEEIFFPRASSVALDLEWIVTKQHMFSTYLVFFYSSCKVVIILFHFISK